jgi:hypothetical protein
VSLKEVCLSPRASLSLSAHMHDHFAELFVSVQLHPLWDPVPRPGQPSPSCSVTVDGFLCLILLSEII